MSQVKDFLNRIRTDVNARKLFNKLKKATSDEEAAEGYISVAKELGFDVAKDEILKFLKFREKVQKAETEKSEAEVKKALTEDDTDAVAGGGFLEYVTETIKNNPEVGLPCKDTYLPGENCYWQDECNHIWNDYTGSDKRTFVTVENVNLAYEDGEIFSEDWIDVEW